MDFEKWCNLEKLSKIILLVNIAFSGLFTILFKIYQVKIYFIIVLIFLGTLFLSMISLSYLYGGD